MLTLTTAEVEYAKKLLANVQRDARFDRWFRWFKLAMGLCMMSMGIWSLGVVQTMNPWLASEPRLSLTQASQPTTKHDLEMAISTMRWEIMQSQGQILVLADACGFAAVGFYVCLTTLVSWTTHRRNALIVKVLRAKLEEEIAQAVPMSANPLAGAGTARTPPPPG